MSCSKLWNNLIVVAGGFLLVSYVAVNGSPNSAAAMAGACPTITRVSVSPLRVSVGEQLDVAVVATDEDGDPIDYLWTSSGGSFADPAAPQTTYECEETGRQAITIAVSAGESCNATWTTNITCVE